MSKKTEDVEQEQTLRIIENSSEIAGAATGAAIGLIIGGPAGAVGGATATPVVTRVLRRVGAEVSRRIMGPREEVRVGAALAFAGQRIDLYLKSGKSPRNDGFFEAQKGKPRPVADELLEGVLIKSRDAYEERKLKLLGSLYANIIFHPEITASQANHLIILLGQLTYRQLLAIGIAYRQGKEGSILWDGEFRTNKTAMSKLGLNGVSLVTELYDLYNRGLLSDSKGAAWISVSDASPGGMRTQGLGAVLAQMADLVPATHEDISELSDLLPEKLN